MLVSPAVRPRLAETPAGAALPPIARPPPRSADYRPAWLRDSASALEEFEGRVTSLRAGVSSLNTGLETIRKAEAVLAARRSRLGLLSAQGHSVSMTDMLERLPAELLGSIVACAGSGAAMRLAATCRAARARLLDDACWSELAQHRWSVAEPRVSDGPACSALYAASARLLAARDADWRRKAAVRLRVDAMARTSPTPPGLPAVAAARSAGAAPSLPVLRPDAVDRSCCLWRQRALASAIDAVRLLARSVRGGHGAAQVGPSGSDSSQGRLASSSSSASSAPLRVRLRDGLAAAALLTSSGADTLSVRLLLEAGAADGLAVAASDSSGLIQELAATVVGNISAVRDDAVRAEVVAAATGGELQRRLRAMLAAPAAPSQPMQSREASRALANLLIPWCALGSPVASHHARGLLSSLAAGRRGQPSGDAAAEAELASASTSDPGAWLGDGTRLGGDATWTLYRRYATGEACPPVTLACRLSVLGPGPDGLGAGGVPRARVLLEGTGVEAGQTLVVAGVVTARADRASVGGRMEARYAGAAEGDVSVPAAVAAALGRVRALAPLRDEGLLTEAGAAPHLDLLLHASAAGGLRAGFWGVWGVSKGPRALAEVGGGALTSGGVFRLVPG